jgi:hypothetical protein
VTRWGGPGEAGQERRFMLEPKDRRAINQAVDATKFFELPEHLGPSAVLLHGPENCLEIKLEGRVRKVFLDEPLTERGPEVERFKRAWKAVVDLSPIKPPL